MEQHPGRVQLIKGHNCGLIPIDICKVQRKYAFELDCIASLNMTCERVGLDHNTCIIK